MYIKNLNTLDRDLARTHGGQLVGGIRHPPRHLRVKLVQGQDVELLRLRELLKELLDCSRGDIRDVLGEGFDLRCKIIQP